MKTTWFAHPVATLAAVCVCAAAQDGSLVKPVSVWEDPVLVPTVGIVEGDSLRRPPSGWTARAYGQQYVHNRLELEFGSSGAHYTLRVAGGEPFYALAFVVGAEPADFPFLEAMRILVNPAIVLGNYQLDAFGMFEFEVDLGTLYDPGAQLYVQAFAWSIEQDQIDLSHGLELTYHGESALRYDRDRLPVPPVRVDDDPVPVPPVRVYDDPVPVPPVRLDTEPTRAPIDRRPVPPVRVADEPLPVPPVRLADDPVAVPPVKIDPNVGK